MNPNTITPPTPQDQAAKVLPLPLGQVFPIMVGCTLFKMSGASIASDSPSYFSSWFANKLEELRLMGKDASQIPTLYIDRDAETFRDIALHLQGYHLTIRDGTHFVRIFADAQFYQLPKLVSQLYEESIFMSIGTREFKIPRTIFTDPKNTPNYFSLGFAMFFSNTGDLFPGLDKNNLLRPPSILPPAVPNKDADVFADILKLLSGYPIEIRNEEHREALLKDARYFNFKAAEQKLIPCQISYNPFRQCKEIVIGLQHIVKSGLSITSDGEIRAVMYKRPYDVDPIPLDLIIEISRELTVLHLSPEGIALLEIRNEFLEKMGRLLQIIAGLLKIPTQEPAWVAEYGPQPRPGITSLTPPFIWRCGMNRSRG